jgi:hypothetical protein
VTNLVLTGQRPALFDLWVTYHFQVGTVAILAGVSVETVESMISYQSVPKDEAQKVLVTLSTLLHKTYTLETVYVPLDREEMR